MNVILIFLFFVLEVYEVDYIYIYSYSVTKDLLENNFIIKDIKANPKNSDRTVFMFEETKELKDYLKQKHNIIL